MMDQRAQFSVPNLRGRCLVERFLTTRKKRRLTRRLSSRKISSPSNKNPSILISPRCTYSDLKKSNHRSLHWDWKETGPGSLPSLLDVFQQLLPPLCICAHTSHSQWGEAVLPAVSLPVAGHDIRCRGG